MQLRALEQITRIKLSIRDQRTEGKMKKPGEGGNTNVLKGKKTGELVYSKKT